MPSRIGALAGRYILTRLLGEDAAIATFEGRDGALDQPVLIKLLPKVLTADPAREERLRRLGEQLAKLDHPNLLSVLETGLEEGVPYLIAEGVAATPLTETMGQALDVERVASIISQIGEALVYAYDQGLAHGNLSPKNVLLTAADRVLLSEVGLESVLETPWEKVQEELVAYLAPERIQGWLLDARADVYASAVILFEMLTGLQLDGAPAQALPWLRDVVPHLAPDLEPVLARALATDPQARYDTVGEFMADLRPILAPYLQPVEAPPLAEARPSPVSVPDEAPATLSVLPSTLITPPLESIPPIAMPEPPPIPTFDWDAFSRQMTLVPLPESPPPPEPPPLPTIAAHGIEWPTVPSAVFEEPTPIPEDKQREETPPESPMVPSPPLSKPQKAPGPAQPSTRSVRPAPPPREAAAKPVQPASPSKRQTSQRQTPAAAGLRVARSARVILIVAVILLLLTFSCCCGLLLVSDLSDTASAPSAHNPPLSVVRCASWMLPEQGCHHDWTCYRG